LKVALFVALVVLFMVVVPPEVTAANQSSFKGASSAVQVAFAAVQTAGNDGGNITSLVAQLNGALALVQKASAENSTDPAQASADLQLALSMVAVVQSSAADVAQHGTSARQLQFETSVASAIVIVGIAVALYAYGDRIYRRIWLRVYGGHVVKKLG